MKTIVPVLEGYSVDGGPIFGNKDMDINIPTKQDLDKGLYAPEMSSKQVDRIFKMMEEMANSPKEEYGKYLHLPRE